MRGLWRNQLFLMVSYTLHTSHTHLTLSHYHTISPSLPHTAGEIAAIVIVVLVVFILLVIFLVVIACWRRQDVGHMTCIMTSSDMMPCPQIRNFYKDLVHPMTEEEGIDLMVDEEKPTVTMLMNNLILGRVCVL